MSNVIRLASNNQIIKKLPNDFVMKRSRQEIQSAFGDLKELSIEEKDGLAMLALAILLCDSYSVKRAARG